MSDEESEAELAPQSLEDHMCFMKEMYMEEANAAFRRARALAKKLGHEPPVMDDGTSTTAKKKRKQKKEKDPDAPDWVLTSYQVFANEQREKGDLPSGREAMSEIARRWRDLDADIKAGYQEQNREARKQYQQDKKAYDEKKRAGSIDGTPPPPPPPVPAAFVLPAEPDPQATQNDSDDEAEDEMAAVPAPEKKKKKKKRKMSEDGGAPPTSEKKKKKKKKKRDSDVEA